MDLRVVPATSRGKLLDLPLPAPLARVILLPSQRFPYTAGQVCWGGGPDEQRSIPCDPRCTSGGDISGLVADQHRTGQVEVEVTRRGKNQTGLRFATLAISLRRVGSQRMVGTCINSVDDDPPCAQRGEKKCVDDHDVRLGGPPVANASLIGDDNHCSTDCLGGGRGIQGEVYRLEVAGLDDVTVDDMPIQDPVAVQEQRGPSRRTSFTSYVAKHESTFRCVAVTTAYATLEALRRPLTT
jgi:hypothetical protein